MLEIRMLQDRDHDDYDELVEQSRQSLLYHSRSYLEFLGRALPRAAANHLIAVEGGRIVAALPLMSFTGPRGIVFNSLPFYGSHGALISLQDCSERARAALVDELSALTRLPTCLTCTVVDNPHASSSERFRSLAAFTDSRIGHWTVLPQQRDSSHIDDSLMGIVHSKVRNQIRKGLTQGYRITHSGTDATLRSLHSLHAQNMKLIGGRAKSISVLDAIASSFEYDRQYRVYTAHADNELAAGLLVFYFKDQVEYFTPAIAAEHRSRQALSALIYAAMRDAVVERGSRLWNWGGTWSTQEGVRHFKTRWGAVERPYEYFTLLGPKQSQLSETSPTELLTEYPDFFVVPFGSLS